MTEPDDKSPQQKADDEMSMEDILSSIRKIITEEQDQTASETAKSTGESEPAAVGSPPSTGQPPGKEIVAGEDVLADDEVLDLTVLDQTSEADEDASLVDFPPEDQVSEGQAPEEQGQHHPEPDEVESFQKADADADDLGDVSSADDKSTLSDRPTPDAPVPSFAYRDMDSGRPSLEEIPQFLTELQEALGQDGAGEDMSVHREWFSADTEPQAASAHIDHGVDEKDIRMTSGTDKLLSPEAALKTSSAFDQLAQTLTSGYAGEDNTLEGLVREMLRPMMREWLDANLPGIVEEMVKSEIQRLSR